MFSASHIYGLDIETDNSAGGGLNPAVGRITEISVSFDGGDAVLNDADEADLLLQLDRVLEDLPPGLIGTWNGTFFDWPFIADRAKLYPPHPVTAGLRMAPEPGLKPKYDFLPGHSVGYSVLYVPVRRQSSPHQTLDISFAYKKAASDLGVKHSLKPVCKAFGIDMVELDREHLERYTSAERDAYVSSDSRGTRQLVIWALGA